MKKTLLILTTLFTVVIGYSQTFTSPDSNSNIIQYTVTSGTTVAINGFTFNNTNVDIPASVSNGGITYNVTAINAFVFGSEQISSVNLPNTLTSIGQLAFSNTDLTGIVFPNSLTTIGDYAFQSSQLQGITIPSNVTNIGNGVFRGNPLTSVTSLATNPPIIITEAGNNDSFATGGNRSGIDLTIPAGTTGAYVTDPGTLWTGFNSVTENLNTGDTYIYNYITYEVISVANSTVKAVDYNTSGGTIVDIPATIPNGLITYNVIEIGNNAFLNNNLTSVTIPDSVISIGEGAFNNNSINSLVLGNNIESIGNWSFQLNNLISVTIPDSVTSIATNAFRFNSITNLVLGNSVETIGDHAFTDNDISSLIIPDSVLTIGDYAFVHSDGMTNLVIGNSVTSIGEGAFAMNASLAQLTSITIPSSVTSIGNYAFAIASLTDVTSLATTPPTITTGTNDTFGSIANRGSVNLHIPPNTQDVYVTNMGALWTDFNSVVEDATLSNSNFELENDIKVIKMTNTLEILFSNSIILEAYSLYNISGVKVVSGKESEITISAFTSGIYILKLDFNTGTVVKKVIVN